MAARFRNRVDGEAADAARVGLLPTREELHRRIDALSEAQLGQARVVILNEVDGETSVESVLARHGERRVGAEEFEEHFGRLPRDGEA